MVGSDVAVAGDSAAMVASDVSMAMDIDDGAIVDSSVAVAVAVAV